MNLIGSLAWSRRAGGRLSAAERLRVLGSAVQSQLRRSWGRGHGPVRSPAGLSLEALRFPDSAALARAFKLCEEAYEPWLLNHCLRTYLWGGLVGQAEGLSVDLEELLLASLYHDIGLTPRGKTEAGGACYAVRGGLFAEKALASEGRTAPASAVAESVCMHLNVDVPRSQPALSYLLHQGAAIDVVGRDLAKVRPLRAQVLERYPRLELKTRLVCALEQEARANPGTRLSLMIRFGFLSFIRNAPFAE